MTDPADNPAPDTGQESRPAILAVDDDLGVLRAVERLLRREGYQVLAATGPTEAIAMLREQEVAVVISDQMMPGMTGIELLTLVRQNWPETVGIMMTACGDVRVAADAVNRRLIHFFIAKPWDNKSLRQIIRDAVELYHKFRQRPDSLAGGDDALRRDLHAQAGKAAFSLARAVDARDRYTHQHSEKVAAYAVIVGRAMGLGREALEELRIGGLLHDVGKIGVPDEVLLKPGRLTDEEYQAIKMHPIIGVSIVEPIEFPWAIAAIVRQHHENHDGTGYPLGLAGQDISLPARIVHVVDAYEAMSANRVYRSARPPAWIEEEFQRCSGSQFDPAVTAVFLGELGQGRILFSGSDEVEGSS